MKRILRTRGIATLLVAAAFLLPGVAAKAWEKVRSSSPKQVTAEQIRENARKANRGNSTTSGDIRMGVSDPSSVRMPKNLNAVNHLTRSPEAPRADFYAVVPQHSLMMTADGAYLGKVNAATGTMTPIFSGAQFRTGTYEYQSGAIRGNYLYVPISAMSFFDSNVYWNEIDLSTGKVVRTIDFGSDVLAAPYTLTYDESTDAFYGIAWNETNELANQIVKFDGKTLAMTYLRDLNGSNSFFTSLAYNPSDKEIYVFDCNNNVFILDRNRGSVLNAGELEANGDYVYFEAGDTAPITYSPKDQCFIMLISDYAIGGYRIMYIDPDSWEVYAGTGLVDPTSAYIASIHCTDQYAEWTAPELPADPEVAFDGSSLDGKITITASLLQFSGLAYADGKKLKTVATIDGTEIFNGELAPGEKKEIAYKGESGEHTLAVYCEDGNKKSPVATKVFHIGYDNPFPVTDLKLDGKVLSWTKSKAGGVHNGYVDDSATYYDVYFGATKQNTRPITSNTYTITDPAKMALTKISVVAVSNGRESEYTSLNEIIGKAKTLPMSFEPTQADLEIIKVTDANNDGETFEGVRFQDIPQLLLRHQVGYYNDPDEWVFLPRAKFEDASKLYSLELAIGGVYTGTTREDVTIYVGEKATPEAMTQKIWERNQLGCPHIPVDYNINFFVPKAGEYYVGIHYHSKKDNKGRGLTLSKFKVSMTDRLSTIPAAATDVTITPAELGLLSAEVSVVIPTKDVMGNDLPADKNVNVSMQCDRVEDFVIVSGKPGETVKGNLEVYQNGFNQFIITTGDESGYGMTSNFERYIGIDVPYAPTNVQFNTQPDNEHVVISWDAPGEVGMNGGYVNPSSLEYSIYMLSRTSAVDPKRVGSTRATTYNFTKPASSFQQEFYNLAPAAENEMGYDSNITFNSDILGKPYLLPMIEEYGTTAFDYMPVMRRTGAGYAGGNWSNVKDLSGMAAMLNGSPICNKGAVMYYSENPAPTKGQIMIPKASTKGINEVLFSAKIWDYKDAPKVYMTGRTSADPNKIIDLGEVNMKRSASLSEWNEQEFILKDEFADKDWIQLFINVEFSLNENEMLVLDNYSIKQNVDYDMQIMDFGGPETTSVGESIDLYTTVSNSGLEPNRGYCTVYLYAPDGTHLDNIRKSVPRLVSGSNGTLSCSFGTLAEWEQYEYILAKAVIEANQDEVATNNEREFKIYLKNSVLPAVSDLSAKYNDDHSEVSLTWSQPDLKYGDNEDMENMPAFEITDKIGLFRNVDLDGRKSFPIEGLSWPNSDKPQAWAVINAEQLGLMNDLRLHPHSGKQYLMARALDYNIQEESAPQACDILVSPEVVGGTEVSFWYNRIAVDYTEYVELWVSTTDDKLGDVRVTAPNGKDVTCGSFTKIQSFSKTGDETWEKVSAVLPENAKYFALVYSSFDEFGAMIDDIQFTPKEMPEWTIDHYSVFRHINETGEVEDVVLNVKDTNALHSNCKDANATYYVRTHVNTPAGIKYGPLSNAAVVYAAGLDDLTDLEGVYGTVGGVLVQGHAGEEFALYTADGKYMRQMKLTNDNQTVAVAPGIYIVKAGNAMVKVLVK
ncbi:MAG: DUF6383 domain-containing protein [Prevotella sp.]|nr:DUF6383 domain-containing protein [Bacteroides sp.]MCM1366214.1 DUF6383 domain-containing protein [Prevotella sp.]MCM1436966.1 DUF6383 domain-containing protein [Prevotella sp.]